MLSITIKLTRFSGVLTKVKKDSLRSTELEDFWSWRANGTEMRDFIWAEKK